MDYLWLGRGAGHFDPSLVGPFLHGTAGQGGMYILYVSLDVPTLCRV